MTARGSSTPVLRRRGEVTACEERALEVRGASLVVHRWTYGGGWSRRALTSRTKRFASACEAQAALRAEVGALLAAGWGELPDWPELPAGWLDAPPRRPPARGRAADRVAAPPARAPEEKLTPVAIGRVRALGPVEPVEAARLDAVGAAFDTAVPRSWRALLGRLGPGTFAGRLRFPSPERVIRETRAFRRSYDGQYQVFFTNHDEVLGAGATKLVLLASSLEGDRVAFVAGAPGRLLILPRSASTLSVVAGLPEVLGRYAAIARDVDGADPSWAPDRGAPR